MAGLLALASPARAEWTGATSALIEYDHNRARAELEAPQLGDLALRPSLNGGWFVQLTDSLGATATADLAARAHATYTGLDQVQAGLSLGLKQKFGLGAFAPVLRGTARVSAGKGREEGRDSVGLEASLQLAKRLHERLSLRLGYEHRTVWARNPLLSEQLHSLVTRAEVGLWGPFALTIGVAAAVGELTLYEAADADEEERVDTFHTPLEPYRRHATVLSASAALSCDLAPRLMASLAADLHSAWHGGEMYLIYPVRLGLHYSF